MKLFARALCLTLVLTVTWTAAASAATQEGTADPDSVPVGVASDEIMMKLASVAPAAERAAFASSLGLEEIAFTPEINWFRFRITDGTRVDEKLKLVEGLPGVLAAHAAAFGEWAYTPTDPKYPNQWGMPKVKMPTAWDLAGGGSTKYMAIVDSGVDLNHEDLGFIYGWNFVSGGSDRGDDCVGHGSMVAGTAAAFTGNGKGIAGVNYAAPILSARMDKWNPVKGICEPYEPAAVEAIYYAVNNGASAITASWYFTGTDSAHQALKDAVNYAWNNNVMVVAAVPNLNQSNFNNYVPARWYNVVTVGGTNSSDKKASFASYGDPGIDVSAPADDIYSTTRTGGYAYGDGVSFAVPFVAGTLGLLKKRYPGVTSQQIKDRLWNTADKVGGYNYTSNPFCGGHSPQLGCGRLDAADAVR